MMNKVIRRLVLFLLGMKEMVSEMKLQRKLTYGLKFRCMDR